MRKVTGRPHEEVLQWAESYSCASRRLDSNITATKVALLFDHDLRMYWNLCALSRSKKADQLLAKKAHKLLFTTRVKIERQVAFAIFARLERYPEERKYLAAGKFFGRSLKQGLSLRLPLYSCKPTDSCSGACYAHDGLDASRASVVRGVFNGVLAELYERGNRQERDEIVKLLTPHCDSAIRAAYRELDKLPLGWQRAPRIRFAHVGEAAAYPTFSSAIAKYFKVKTNGDMACTVYTRHKDAVALPPSLFIVNFTLDRDSLGERKKWVPSWARTVFSAFDGVLSSEAAINFIEHHQNGYYAEPSGEGALCPATSPLVEEHFCDSCRCDFCFKVPEKGK
ncbi:hypothetical protein [Desulfosediminicola flagellatus]|uniref:hypothetical protein n=1 Tax=Desulfosediminicola flagellatus TaxID=2569541 RepID=UPI0010AB6016|nr:hypothetical protein [Desulfosediminicola flagellatus]